MPQRDEPAGDGAGPRGPAGWPPALPLEQAAELADRVLRAGVRGAVDLSLRVVQLPGDVARLTRSLGDAPKQAVSLGLRAAGASVRLAGTVVDLARGSRPPDWHEFTAPATGAVAEPAEPEWGASAEPAEPGWGASAEPAGPAGPAVPAKPAKWAGDERPLPPATQRLRDAVMAPAPAREPPPAADLPLANFDEMTLGSLRSRVRRLDEQQLRQLRDYELAHGHRGPVLTVLENRLWRLREGGRGGDGPAG